MNLVGLTWCVLQAVWCLSVLKLCDLHVPSFSDQQGPEIGYGASVGTTGLRIADRGSEKLQEARACSITRRDGGPCSVAEKQAGVTVSRRTGYSKRTGS
jgi:hypothetical protein